MKFGFKICRVKLVQESVFDGGDVEIVVCTLDSKIKDTFDTYPEAEKAIESLPKGHYQIQKIYTVD